MKIKRKKVDVVETLHTTIYYMGYVDEEEKSFQEKLNKIVDDFKNGKLNIDDNKQ